MTEEPPQEKEQTSVVLETRKPQPLSDDEHYELSLQHGVRFSPRSDTSTVLEEEEQEDSEHPPATRVLSA